MGVPEDSADSILRLLSPDRQFDHGSFAFGNRVPIILPSATRQPRLRAELAAQQQSTAANAGPPSTQTNGFNSPNMGKVKSGFMVLPICLRRLINVT